MRGVKLCGEPRKSDVAHGADVAENRMQLWGGSLACLFAMAGRTPVAPLGIAMVDFLL